MKDKIIVISGATRGIGLALKEKLAVDNTVIVFSRSEKENGLTSFCADVSDRADVKRVFDEIGRLYGRIDILINNAGYGLSGATELLAEEDIRKIVDVNLLGVIWCCQCALPYMGRGAKIASISSASGICPMPYRAMYNCTKAAVTNFSYSLNSELHHLGIYCTAFILGAIDTDFSKNRIICRSTNERYGDDIKAVDDFVEKPRGYGRMKKTTLVNYIVRKLSLPRLRIHYIVGVRYKLAAVFEKFFPTLTQNITNYVMRKF